jgi:hypothetical protein
MHQPHATLSERSWQSRRCDTHSKDLGTDWEVGKQIVDAVKAPWYFIEVFNLPLIAYEMRLSNAKLDWQVDLFFMTPDEEDETQVYFGYHPFPGIYFCKVYFNKTVCDRICHERNYFPIRDKLSFTDSKWT